MDAEAPVFSAALCRGLIEAFSGATPMTPTYRSFPRLYAAASLKRRERLAGPALRGGFSAALCRGLIEALIIYSLSPKWCCSFPRLYAAASLKHDLPRVQQAFHRRFSAALCRGLIEAAIGRDRRGGPAAFSAALCRGLIEAQRLALEHRLRPGRFPRLYAAASLKRDARVVLDLVFHPFSAALCRGLIEARLLVVQRRYRYCVFRGFMPRPH